MLIYTNNSSGCVNKSFGESGYKNAGNRKRDTIRAKTSKRTTRQLRPPHSKVKKKNIKRKSKKKKKLNANNVKFLKKLGFRVKK